MNEDLKNYLDKMPKELKDRYEYIKYRFGENWNDNFYRKPITWLEENEANFTKPKFIVDYKK